MERIASLLSAYRIPITTVPATKRTTSSARWRFKATAKKVNAVIVSGDKDFQQLVRPGIWLLNPGAAADRRVSKSTGSAPRMPPNDWASRQTA